KVALKSPGKTIIPILHRKCDIPLNLEGRQRVDFRLAYKTGLAAVQDLTKPVPAPPWYVRLLRFTGVRNPVAVLAILSAVFVYSLLPSRTSATLIHKDTQDALYVLLENRGSKPSAV